MRIRITEDWASIEAARRTAEESERRLIDEAFASIAGPGSDRTIGLAHVRALIRHRETVVPRLRRLADGQDDAGPASRLAAAVALCKVDPRIGIETLWRWLGDEGPRTVGDGLSELLDQAGREEGGDYLAELARGEPGRLFRLLDRPDDRVRNGAFWLVEDLKPPGWADRFLGLIDQAERRDDVARRPLSEAPDRLREHIAARLVAPGGAGEVADLIATIGRIGRGGLARGAGAILESLDRLPGLSAEGKLRVGEALRSIPGPGPKTTESGAGDPSGTLAALDILVEAGLISPPEAEDTGREIRELLAGRYDAATAVIWALRRAGWLVPDAEEDDFPRARDELLRDMSETSRGPFAPEAIFQARGSDSKGAPVQFLHRGWLYRTSLDGDGPGDVAVIAMANRALADIGESRRFFWLIRADMRVGLVFGDLEATAGATSEAGLTARAVPEPEVVHVASLPDPIVEWGLDQALRLFNRRREEPISPDSDWMDSTDQYGRTPLHFAAEEGRTDLIDVLLDAGASLDAMGSSGSTPLLTAASADRIEAVARLIDRGASARARDGQGLMPLHRAANAGALGVVKLLLERGFEVDARTSSELAARGDDGEPLPDPTAAFLGLLNWHLGGKVEDRQTPLHRAALRDREAVVALLLDRGADINARDAKGQTPLHLAVSNDSHKAATLLRALGADEGLPDDRGRTPGERAGDNDRRHRSMGRRIRLFYGVIFPAIKVALVPFVAVGWIRRRLGGGKADRASPR